MVATVDAAQSIQGLASAGNLTLDVSDPDALFVPLFEDDFSSGDFSKYNDYFRWGGSGALPSAGFNSSTIFPVTGPQGTTVNAWRAQYGTWQEARFHLTNSISQVISDANADTDVQYDEVWISYDMLVPANYAHRSPGGSDNNKGFVSLWQDAYSDQAKCQAQIEWWPEAGGTSEMSVNVGGHWRDFNTFVDPAYVTDAVGYDGCKAFLNSDFGTWKNFTFYFYAGSVTGANDGIFEFYVDGQLKGKITNMDMERNPSETDPLGFNKGYLLGLHNSGYDEPTNYYITNFKFGTAGKETWRSNEPPGLTALEPRTYTTISETGWWGSTQNLPYWQTTQFTSPASSRGTQVGRFTYPAGLGGGGSPGSDGIDPANSAIWTGGSREVYLCFEIFFSSNWQGHPTGTNKIFFVTMSSYGGNGDPCFLSLETNYAAGPQIVVRNQGAGGDAPTTALFAEEVIVYGTWNTVEVRLLANSADNVSDGELHLWVNGRKTQEDLSCEWANASALWDSVRWEPTWGGGGGTVVSDMYQQISEIFVATG